MSYAWSNVGAVVGTLIRTRAYRATKYVNKNRVIKATRRHKSDKRDRQSEFVVTIGKPNYREREFIKLCRKAGEPFPVKKVQLKFPPTAKT